MIHAGAHKPNARGRIKSLTWISLSWINHVAMRLADYLAETGLTQPEFAARLGVSQSTVSRWCAGIPPRRRHLDKLRKETGGKITLASFEPQADEAAA